jgi:hypothetical protein
MFTVNFPATSEPVRWQCGITRCAEALYPKARWHWCWRDETPVGHPRTGGDAFWNPELASAENQCARACENMANDRKELGWVAASGVHELTPTKTVSTDEQMSPSARPFKIARLTGEMPRSAAFGSSALITLAVLHALPVLARINVVGFAECSHEA